MSRKKFSSLHFLLEFQIPPLKDSYKYSKYSTYRRQSELFCVYIVSSAMFRRWSNFRVSCINFGKSFINALTELTDLITKITIRSPSP